MHEALNRSAPAPPFEISPTVRMCMRIYAHSLMPPRIQRRCMSLLRLRILRRGSSRQRMRRLAHPRRLGGSQPQVCLPACLYMRPPVCTDYYAYCYYYYYLATL